MALNAHIVDKSGDNVTFMLRDDESEKEMVRTYRKGDLPQLRQVIDASQKYFLYLKHGTRAKEEYSSRQKEMQQNMQSVIEQLEGSDNEF